MFVCFVCLLCLFAEGPEEYNVLPSNGPPLIREVKASSPKTRACLVFIATQDVIWAEEMEGGKGL